MNNFKENHEDSSPDKLIDTVKWFLFDLIEIFDLTFEL